jgi:hypothetical protein
VAVEEEREVENKMAPPLCVSRSAPSRRRVEASAAAAGSPGAAVYGLPRRPLFSTSPDRCLLRHFADAAASDRMEAGRDDGAKRMRAAMVRCLRPLSLPLDRFQFLSAGSRRDLLRIVVVLSIVGGFLSIWMT